MRHAYLEHLMDLNETFPNISKLTKGDFNSPNQLFGSRNTNSSGNKLFTWIAENNYKAVKMDTPTYISHRRVKAQNVLDFVLHNENTENLISQIT